MGFWGTGLYDNDTAEDVKGRFDELIREHRSEVKVAEIMEEEYADSLSDEHERFLFYTALADTQWEWGRLTDRIKEKALHELMTMDESLLFIDPNDSAERRKVLDDLIEKLNSEQPPAKRIVKRRLFRCNWNNGDTFSLPLVSEKARELGFEGGRLLICKVSQKSWYPGHIIPLVYFKLLKDCKEKISLEDYNNAEYVQTRSVKFSERFMPLDFSDIKGDIERKSKLEYKTDEYGRLPVFRAAIITTNEKQIPAELEYVGNFSDAKPPENECVLSCELNYHHFKWKRNDGRTLEEELLPFYEGHNLRQYDYYTTIGDDRVDMEDPLQKIIAAQNDRS